MRTEIFNSQRTKKKTPPCTAYFPIHSEDPNYCMLLMDKLRKENIPTKQHKLKRHCPAKCRATYVQITNDDIYSLDEYYVNMINDTLEVIRDGLTAYLFKESQVAEVLRFEPNINVLYHDGVFYITL